MEERLITSEELLARVEAERPLPHGGSYLKIEPKATDLSPVKPVRPKSESEKKDKEGEKEDQITK